MMIQLVTGAIIVVICLAILFECKVIMPPPRDGSFEGKCPICGEPTFNNWVSWCKHKCK